MVPYTLERIDIGRLEEIKLKIIMYCNVRVYGTHSKFNYFLDGTVSQIIQQIESMYVRAVRITNCINSWYTYSVTWFHFKWILMSYSCTCIYFHLCTVRSEKIGINLLSIYVNNYVRTIILCVNTYNRSVTWDSISHFR